MNRKQSPEQQYMMNYYPGGLAPAGYVAAADKPGLYAASPYAGIPSPYATPQPGVPTAMQRYTSAQQYTMVSQPSPYSQQSPAAYYAASAGYPTMQLASIPTIPSSNPQASYLTTSQYPTPLGFQAGQLGPTSVAAAGYGGSPLYAGSSYAGLPAVPAQPSRTYGIAPMGYTTTPGNPSSPAYPGVVGFGPPY